MQAQLDTPLRHSPLPPRATVAVIGTNYVGLVTAACLAGLGHTVIGIDIDPQKVARLSRGELPIYEPGLDALVQAQLAAGRLRFSLDYTTGLAHAQFAFVCVGTPPGADGSADQSQVRAATASLARHLPAGASVVIVNKSTMPIGTGDWMQAELAARVQDEVRVTVVSNPEFLREGSAVVDFQHPDRIVLGGSDVAAVDAVAALYTPLEPAPPVLKTDLRTAEMIKYASNAFLATKISFINEMAAICEKIDADVTQVAAGMGLDQRIGPRFLSAGVGYGGSCFPKDVRALEHTATRAGAEPRLLRAVMDVNQDMRRLVMAKLQAHLGSVTGRRIGLLGLAFKADTDDIRESPAIDLARLLLAAGAEVRAFDPAAMGPAAVALPDLQLCATAYAAAEDADALLVLTEWPQFQNLDLVRLRQTMRQPVLIDGRNLFDPRALADLGFDASAVGRGRDHHLDAPSTPLAVFPRQLLAAARPVPVLVA